MAVHVARRVGPGLSIEACQDGAAQLAIEGRMVAFNLQMHHHLRRLLDHPNLAELDGVTEAADGIGAAGIGAEITARDAGQHEKKQRGAEQDRDRQSQSCA